MSNSGQHEQKLLKLFIRLMLPVFTLAGFGGLASIALLGLRSEKTLSAVYSSDGRYRARVIEMYGDAGCGNATSYAVLVERRWAYLKTGQVEPFCFTGSPSQLAVRWNGPAALSIACASCDPDDEFFYDRNWGELRFQYDLSRQ